MAITTDTTNQTVIQLCFHLLKWQEMKSNVGRIARNLMLYLKLVLLTLKKKPLGEAGDEVACPLPGGLNREEHWGPVHDSLHAEHRVHLLQCF